LVAGVRASTGVQSPHIGAFWAGRLDIGLGVVASSSRPWHLCLLAPEKRSTHVFFAPQIGWSISHPKVHLSPPGSKQSLLQNLWTELLALLQEERDVEGTL